MNPEALHPFFHRRGDRQRLILYLIAEGYSAPKLSRLTIAELSAMNLPDEIMIYRDRVLDLLETQDQKAFVFVYPNGRVMGPTDFYRLVAQTTERTLGHPLSHKQFAEYLRKSGKRGKANKTH
ncbi:MAG: hypothetical protein FD165_2677 [Gammaproteobacteria bacterium]|nr:MAG: hypothetical protein FD165_2677 [Gammaproteobacteria bacterium]TND01150.1 MAG: hypothetical protein FD120_2686 [Gammaproteobacteria bacterium]